MSNNALRQQLGISVPATKPDLSKAGFDFLHLEHERLLAEQVKRTRGQFANRPPLQRVRSARGGATLVSLAPVRRSGAWASCATRWAGWRRSVARFWARTR